MCVWWGWQREYPNRPSLYGIQVLESVQLKQEVTHIEEERIQVVNNIEELEQKIKDLDNQMEESVREVRTKVQHIAHTVLNTLNKCWKYNYSSWHNNTADESRQHQTLLNYTNAQQLHSLAKTMSTADATKCVSQALQN